MREVLFLFWVFFRIGAITFGSGYVMVTVVEREFVDKRKWISKENFMSYMTLATSFPGPIVINLASLIGHQKFGVKGLVAGMLGASLPSFIILLIVAMTFSNIIHEPVIEAIFKALRPAVVGVMIYPVISFAKSINRWEYPIFVAVGLLLYFQILSPMLLILAGVLAGSYLAFSNQRASKKINEE